MVKSLAIALSAAVTVLVVMALMRFRGAEPFPSNPVLLNMFSVLDIAAALITGWIAVFSVNRAKQKNNTRKKR